MGRKVERFEDLIAWQKARVLRFEFTRVTFELAWRKNPSLCDQVRRAARSVMANIAEGFDRHSRPEFHRFLGIAKGSCAELHSDLYAALDDGLVNKATFDKLYSQGDEVARILGGLRSSIREPAKKLR